MQTISSPERVYAHAVSMLDHYAACVPCLERTEALWTYYSIAKMAAEQQITADNALKLFNFTEPSST